MTPYYSDDAVVIYHGDSRDVLPSLGAPGVTATVFSPPYNVELGYDQHDDAMGWDAYRLLADEVCAAVASAQPHGRTWVNVTPIVPAEAIPAGDHSGRSSNPRRSLVALWTNALELNRHGVWDYIAWVTPGRGPGCSWGSWESPSGPNMRGEWETIIAFRHRSPSRSLSAASGCRRGQMRPCSTPSWAAVQPFAPRRISVAKASASNCRSATARSPRSACARRC